MLAISTPSLFLVPQARGCSGARPQPNASAPPTTERVVEIDSSRDGSARPSLVLTAKPLMPAPTPKQGATPGGA
jgi:hypothetical protein